MNCHDLATYIADKVAWSSCWTHPCVPTAQRETLVRFLIWWIGDFAENHQIKNPPIIFHTLLHYVEVLAIAKFKVRQCILMTDSPNLMFTKVSRYTVYLQLNMPECKHPLAWWYVLPAWVLAIHDCKDILSRSGCSPFMHPKQALGHLSNILDIVVIIHYCLLVRRVIFRGAMFCEVS